MSPQELEKIRKTGRVQEGGGGQTRVAIDVLLDVAKKYELPFEPLETIVAQKPA